MKHWCLYGLIIAFAASGGAPWLAAQSTIDPQDGIYRQLEIWEAAGLIPALPPLRPYTASFVAKQLTTVKNQPNAAPIDRQIADELLSSFNKLHPGVEFKGRTDGSTNFGQGAAALWGQGAIAPWLEAAVNLHLWAVYNINNLTLPAGVQPVEDFVTDDASIGADKSIAIREMALTGLDILPLPDVDLHAGFNRNSIGPFGTDGIVFGPQSPAAGSFSIRYTNPGFIFSMGFFPIVATYDDGTGASSNKYLYYHGIDFPIIPAIQFGMFETVVGGPSVQPLYFIPLSVFFSSQGVGGFQDNSQIGLSLQIQPVNGLRFKGVYFIDDLEFDDLFQLKFNTKWKFASQVGFVLVPAALARNPNIAWLSMIQFDWTAVMPYTYTHYNDTDNGAYTDTAYNYENYTNQGQNIGPALEPNSDRWNLEAQFHPQHDLEVDFGALFIRHGNASDGIIPGRDGSIFDDGYYPGGGATYSPPYSLPAGVPYTRFLTQTVLEETLQLHLAVQGTLGLGLPATPLGDLKGSLSYTLQNIWNPGFVSGTTATNHFLELTIGYWY